MDYPQIPGYEIEAEIGTGGMGVVYRARHLSLDRIVALKVIHPKFVSDETFVRSFAQEAKIVAKLSHPNLVSVYDFGCHEGLYYLSMQYVQGTTLRELLFTRKPTLDELAEILNQVGEALDYAHREQVVHRDIKPGNILLCPNGKSMVIDFGVAFGTHSMDESSVWLAAGSGSYMSPEQCKGQNATPRSDQYSLAVVVYEMLTGRLPFTATDPQAVRRQHASEMPPPMRTGRTDITPRIEAAVVRAMSKIPEMRFGSVGAFTKELSAAFKEAEASENILAAAAATAVTVSAVASVPRGGAVSLVDSSVTAAPPRTVHREGYLYVTRGSNDGGRRKAALAWLLILVVIGGIGGAGYATHARYTAQQAALRKSAATPVSKSTLTGHSSRRSRRSRRRAASHLSTTPPESGAKTGAIMGPPVESSPKPAATLKAADPAEKPTASDAEEPDKSKPVDEKDGEASASASGQ